MTSLMVIRRKMNRKTISIIQTVVGLECISHLEYATDAKKVYQKLKDSYECKNVQSKAYFDFFFFLRDKAYFD